MFVRPWNTNWKADSDDTLLAWCPQQFPQIADLFRLQSQFHNSLPFLSFPWTIRLPIQQITYQIAGNGQGGSKALCEGEFPFRIANLQRNFFSNFHKEKPFFLRIEKVPFGVGPRTLEFFGVIKEGAFQIDFCKIYQRLSGCPVVARLSQSRCASSRVSRRLGSIEGRRNRMIG